MDDYDELPQDAVYKKSNFINIFKKWKNNERNEKKKKKIKNNNKSFENIADLLRLRFVTKISSTSLIL